MIVNVLDRILDSDYVTVSLTVDIIDHCGQRGGFSRTGRPRYQNHSSRSQRKFSQKRGKSQILQSGNLVKKKAHGYRVISALTVNVDSVPLPRRGNKGKVRVQPLLNDLFMLYRSNLVDNVYYKRLGHIGVLGEFFYIAVYSDYRGQTHREMYVRRFYRPCLIENFVDIQCHCPGFLSFQKFYTEYVAFTSSSSDVSPFSTISVTFSLRSLVPCFLARLAICS